MPPLKRGGNTITLLDEIADTLKINMQIYRETHKKRKLGNIERGRKKKTYHTINHLQKEN